MALNETLYNVGLSLPIGAGVGALAAVLRRKAELEQLKEEGFIYPEERAMLPSLPAGAESMPAPKKRKLTRTSVAKVEKSGAISMGHVAGGGAGLLGAQYIVSDLMSRKHGKLLDAAIAKRDKALNDLLIQEQAMSSGVSVPTTSLISKAASVRKHILDAALAKIASDVFDVAEKQADMPVSRVVHKLVSVLGLPKKDKATYKGIMLAALLGGGAYGYHIGSKGDPSRLMAEAVKGSLKERLTGKDQLVGPMPIRVETEVPVMKPIRPGASSLVDPTKGRDVLEGI